MKKIKLNLASMQATEILSRDQLKSIFGGGSGSDSGGGSGGFCGTSAILYTTNSCTTSNGKSGTCGIVEINHLLYCGCYEN